MTPLQRQLYDFIRGYWAEHGFAPSYEIMAVGIGLKSKSGIHRMIHSMAQGGFIEIRQSRYRSVRCLSLDTSEYSQGFSAGYAAAVAELKREAA